MKKLFFLYVWLNLTRIAELRKEDLVKHIRKRTIQTGRLFFSSSLKKKITIYPKLRRNNKELIYISMINKHVLSVFSLLIFSAFLIAQPVNDECANAIQLTDITDWCSAPSEFTNVGATASSFGAASCFSNANNDVWFSFTALASDVTVAVLGAVPIAAGGTLNNPAVALYSGDCDDVISELQCEADLINNNIIEMYRGGLTVGETYYIRVNGRSNNTGTFELCINNYYPPVDPGSDCNLGAILCDTAPFTIQSVVGAGSDTNEADGSCLGASGGSETNSTWFSWTASNNGALNFILTPTNPEDDLDFVLYELPNGLNNCAGKQVLRCMASGDFGTSGAPCMGATGLAASATDTEEAPGCSAGDDNFLAPLQQDAGTSYALLINNFTSTGNGFSMSFGGTAQFVGPNADFTDNDPDDTVCAGESITFEDNSAFSLGPIMGWEWNFGVGAVPQTATGAGPHAVQFTQPGQISVVLRVETQLGCIVSHVVDYTIDACCDGVNEMFSSFTQNNLDCADDADGAIDVTVSGGTPPFEFEWSTGDTSEDLNDLVPGNYLLTITDQIGCNAMYDIDISGPPLYDYAEAITMPTCGGGTDGAIDLTVGGATPPYTFAWAQNGAPFGGNTEDLTNIPVGDYSVLITDNNSCEISRDFEVRELELILDPDANIVLPSCNGASDGTIELNITNGLPPYEFDLNDGNGFTSNSIIQNVAAGTYTVTVRDANMCMGNIDIEIMEPDVLEVTLDGMDISCFGYDDGSVDATTIGGTMPYSYSWNPVQTDTSNLTDLSAGDYTVSVTDNNGCTATAMATIIEPLAVNIDSIMTADNACFGGTDGALTIFPSGGSPPFQYSSDGITFQDSPTLTGLSSGTVTVTIRDVFGCDFSAETTISQPIELILNAGNDVEIDLSYTTDLDAVLTNSNIEHTIVWTPEIGLSCTDCFDPTAAPPITTTYVATITTIEGCTATDSVTVTVNDVRPVYIPNVFSPNFDGSNDNFTAFGGQAATLIKAFRVFDRWGGLMYVATNIDPNNLSVGWDGTNNGREVGQGVYVYHIRIEFFDGEIFDYQGDVMVVR